VYGTRAGGLQVVQEAECAGAQVRVGDGALARFSRDVVDAARAGGEGVEGGGEGGERGHQERRKTGPEVS